MTHAIASDHCSGNLSSDPRARTVIPGEPGCPAAKGARGAGPPVSRSGRSLRFSGAVALRRGMILVMMGGSAWILAGSLLFQRETLSALSAVFVAATISSIAGFAFSAVAGGMLLHLVDSTVKVVIDRKSVV